jgi:hypothetical protein
MKPADDRGEQRHEPARKEPPFEPPGIATEHEERTRPGEQHEEGGSELHGPYVALVDHHDSGRVAAGRATRPSEGAADPASEARTRPRFAKTLDKT